MTISLPSARSRMRSSRLGGVPAVLPPVGLPPTEQLTMGFDDDGRASDAPASPPPPELVRPLPDVAHVRGWLSPAEQQALVAQFRSWALPPAGLRHPRVPAGHVMSVQSVCLGWHWQPYAYSRTADDTDGAPVKPMPPEVVELARRAVTAAGIPEEREREGAERGSDCQEARRQFGPDAAIVNFYAPGARLGLHQDGEEPSDAPVVTISLGDTCVFRFAGVDRRTRPFTDIRLHSGDLLVFGGCNRRIYHGVPKVLDGTAPRGLDLPPGRLSITVRETGLR